MEKDKYIETIETKLPISIVIPAYSEEYTLPVLLESIKSQIVQPLEVIVADADSPDLTAEIARSYGATVVTGGRIAFGRNAGAAVAKGELILFMDADTQLPSELTLAEAYLEFMQRGYDIASAHYGVMKKNTTLFGIFAGYLFTTLFNVGRRIGTLKGKPVSEGGAFILVKRKIHEEIGGFDENVRVGEDQEYFLTASRRKVKYGSIPLRIKISNRRYDTPQKLFKVTVWGAMYAMFLALGVYSGSKFLRRSAGKLYGNLGGGKGKKPTE
jgi:glycosyltransferase involved in cell wall biosynthesis